MHNRLFGGWFDVESKQVSEVLDYLNTHRDLKRTQYFQRLKRKLVIKKLENECERKGAFIPASAYFGLNTVFPHGINGIFISQGAFIGNNAVIFHQVTIGSNTIKESKGFGAPVIGDNVYIGAGAKIIGRVKIGDNVRIGANVVVTIDIPSNCTVVGGVPRIITHEKILDNSFHSWK